MVNLSDTVIKQTIISVALSTLWANAIYSNAWLYKGMVYNNGYRPVHQDSVIHCP